MFALTPCLRATKRKGRGSRSENAKVGVLKRCVKVFRMFFSVAKQITAQSLTQKLDNSALPTAIWERIGCGAGGFVGHLNAGATEFYVT